MKKISNILKAVIISVLLIIILVFAFQNIDPVSVDFFNLKSKEIPLFILMLGVLVLGVLVGYLMGLMSGSKIADVKIEKINIKANEQIANAEEKVIALEKKIKTIKPIVQDKQ